MSAANTDQQTEGRKTRVSVDWLQGEPQALPKRKLDEETCRKFGYLVGTNRAGKPVQIANYRNMDGQLVAQKVRDAAKGFTVVGGGRDMPLFGQHLWPSSGRRVVVTEGEIDALSVAQACGLSWPVVSLPNGAQSAKKTLQANLEWLEGYETVVLCFDMDEPGRKASAECAPLFSPGRCAIAELPRKDPNECLQAGLVKDLVSALWNARVFRPDGIVSLVEIEDRVLADPEVGMPWFLDGMTKITYGRRPGDVIGLGAGTGCGKSDLFAEQVAFDVMTLGKTVGVLFLEQGVGDTGRRVAGKLANRRFHVPGDGWTQEELVKSWGALKATNRLHLYDAWGVADWPTIRSKIRYMRSALGCDTIFLDHLTALAAAEDDEKKALERIMAEAAGDAQALGHVLHYVSHLATPEGKPHEEGGRVMAKHFKGSRAIIYWSHILWGLERDTQTPGSPTTLRCLKERLTGQGTGKVMGIGYDPTTGRMSECPIGGDAKAHGFEPENNDF